MSKVALDLKQFKHVKSDKHSTTLKHKDGHELKVAHKALSPEFKTQLEALAPAGGKKPKKMAAGGVVKGEETQPQADQPEQKGIGTKIAETLQVPQNYLMNKAAQAVGVEGDPNSAEHSIQNMVEAGANKIGIPADSTMGNAAKAATVAGLTLAADPMNLIPGEKVAQTAVKGAEAAVDMNKVRAALKLLHEGNIIPVESLTADQLKRIEQLQIKNGFMVKGPHLAEGGEVQADSPFTSIDSTVQQMPEQPAAAQPAMPDDVARKRALYNDIVPHLTQAVPETADRQAYQNSFMFGNNGETPQNFDPAAWRKAEQVFTTEAADKQVATQKSLQSDMETNNAREAAGLSPLPSSIPITALPNKDLDPNTAAQATAIAQPQQPSNVGSPIASGEGVFMKGYQEGLGGIYGAAKAAGDLGQQQAVIHEQAIKTEQLAKDAYQKQYEALDGERQNLMHDVQNGFVKPEQYWTGVKNPVTGKMEGGHSKIMSAIGLILAGFNPAGQPNAALNMMQFQMNKNLEAQSQNLQAKNNLLAHNLQQFGNLRDAAQFTRIQMNDMLGHQLDMEAAKAQDPMAKARGMEAAGQFRMNAANQFRTFAMMRAMMNLANGSEHSPDAVGQMIAQLRVMNPEAAKEMEGRFVPNVGMAKVPVPDNVRQQIVATKSVNDLFNDSLKFSQEHRGTLDPKLRAQASTIQQQLIGSIKQAQHDGVYKPSEADFLLSQIGGNPASFMANFSSVPKIKQLQQIKQQEFNQILNTYGLPQQSLAQIPQYKIDANGVKWMRGPNGEAIRVK